MRFIIFTSLFSLIGIFLLLYVIRFISKKMKPVVNTGKEIISDAVKSINNATPAISHYTSSFFSSVNSGLTSFNVDLAVNRFQDYLSQNSVNIDHVNEMIGNLDVKFKIEEESRKIVENEYIQTKKDFEKYMADSIRSNDADLVKKIKNAKLKIDILHNNIKCQKRFYVSKALCDELSKNK